MAAPLKRIQKTCTECSERKPVSEFSPGMSRCKSCRNATLRAQYAAGSPGKNRDTVYAANLMRNYGLTMDDYDRLLAGQAYRCAICRRAETKLRRDGTPYRLAVDHDHVTKKVRGLLCHNCNAIVWALEENHTLLPAINAYLDEFRGSLAR